MKKMSFFRLTVLVIVIVMIFQGCGNKKKSANDYFKEGQKLFQQQKYSEAIEKYEKGLNEESDNAVGYNLMGMAYRFRFNETGTQEYKEKEIAAFKKAVELDPKYWVAYKNLSASLYYEGRKKEAVPYIEKSLELQPDDPEKEILQKWLKEGQKK